MLILSLIFDKTFDVIILLKNLENIAISRYLKYCKIKKMYLHNSVIYFMVHPVQYER